MRATGAEVVKVAVMARRLADNVPLLACGEGGDQALCRAGDG